MSAGRHFPSRTTGPRRECLGPFQDALVAEAIDGIEGVFRQIATARGGVDETELRAWVAWAYLRAGVE
jgi:hypothetical protein